ncbi:putative F-box protein At1g46984 [Apium graveolens]|uniref:putative F-box protein At1g46984 n=1 Tax=Apium graveolens TaxID=4045 RepID=UPI003D7C0329
MANTSIVDLPEGMLSEIVARLPVKSPVVCKSVCKPWLHTISNPHFVKFQFRHAIIASTNNPTLHAIEIPPPDADVCFLGRPADEHFIVNSQSLPWFGYDSFSDAYKVVREKLDDEGSIVQLYSTSTDSWTEFQEPILKCNEVYDATTVVVDGFLYFCGARARIISFDLHKDIFGVVPLPSFTSIGKGSDVLNYQGSVAMILQGRNLWTLDDVSGKVSWTKRFSTEINENML